MAEDMEEELEAVTAVYGADCVVLQRSPPYILVSMKPRTADDTSKQFVEAVLAIKANAQYPCDPPKLELKDTKGLDEERLARLLSSLQVLANELAFNPMLVALCEAATYKLTDMNQPEGNCCFCMFPLVIQDKTSEFKPFMKLLSCFHCFHSDCFGRWWRWVLRERNVELSDAQQGLLSQQDGSGDSFMSHKVMLEKLLDEIQLKCPVCRKSINSEDIASVGSFLVVEPTAEQDQEQETKLGPEFVFSEKEIARKNDFEDRFKAQQLRCGIIEPKKLEVIMPGMFLAPPARVSLISSSEPSERAGVSWSDIQNLDRMSLLTSRTTVRSSSHEVDGTVLAPQPADAQAGQDPGNSAKLLSRVNGEQNGHVQRRGRQPKFSGAKQKGHWIRREREGSM